MTVVSVHPARRFTSPLAVVPAGLGDGVDHGVGHCHDVAELPRVCLFLYIPCGYASSGCPPHAAMMHTLWTPLMGIFGKNLAKAS